ncbi:MAG: diguanylate cyclase [Lachnospiraceae bacterium]|nr:diguanylate cyclase [Lachnospiraceae bacterium]
MDQQMSELEALDSKLREINLLFEDVLLLNHRDNSLAPLLGGFRYVDNPDYLYSNYKHNVERASENIIYPTEKKRYLEFMDLDTMKSRIDKSGKGYVESVFRVKQEDGSFKHKDLIIMQIPATNGNEFLFCMRPYMMIGIDDYMFDNRVGNADESVIEFANLWRNAIWNTRIKVFWKDKNRVFRGVSRSFMDYFGIDNENDIIGKTDDERQWFLDENMFKKDELGVLNTGKPVSNITIRVIAKGSAKVIVISMIPVYKNDEIIGTMGYFVDVEEDRKKQEQMDILKMTDPVTGLINIHTFMESMIDLALQYEEKKKDYGLILLKNTRHDRIVESYDEEFANKVLRKMGQVILDIAGDKAVVARTRESIFAVLMPVSNYDDLRAYQDKLKNSLNAITEVEGLSITPRVKGACHMRSEQGMSDAGIFDITRRELADTENS